MEATTGRTRKKDADQNKIVKKAPIVKSPAKSSSNNKTTELKTLTIENQDIEQIKDLIRKNPLKCAKFLKILPKKLIDKIINEVRNIILKHPGLCAEIIKSLPSDKIHLFTEAIKKSISRETCIDIIKALPNNQLHHYKTEVKEIIKISPEKYLRIIKALPKEKQNPFLPLMNDLAKHAQQPSIKPIKKIANNSEIITKIKNIISDQTKFETKKKIEPLLKLSSVIKIKADLESYKSVKQKKVAKAPNNISTDKSTTKRIPLKILEGQEIQTKKAPNLNSAVKTPKGLEPTQSIETLKKESFVEKIKKQRTNSIDHPLST
jgi:hypothetical protein